MESQAHPTLAQSRMLLARVMTLPVLNKQGGYKRSRQVIKQVPMRLFYHITFRVPTKTSYRARWVCTRMGTAGDALRRVCLTVSAAGQGWKPSHKLYESTVRTPLSTKASERP